MNKPTPVLYRDKAECCGCGACMNVCPQNAISMQEDACGFRYPIIDENLCIRCGRCVKVCAFQNTEETHSPVHTYAAVSKDPETRRNSASGGVFAELAKQVISEGGAVVGAGMEDDFTVHHCVVESEKDLVKLQGSKYTHSAMEYTYRETKQLLCIGRQVLFSGTPCQVAGLYGYLGKDYTNLVTMDLVCHGVPSNRMFRDYVKVFGISRGGEVRRFVFRDKTVGWGINGSAEIRGKKYTVWQSASSYLYYFTRGWLYRSNCYVCKYASSHRPADLTVGDYWGIEKQHPEYLGKGGWDESKGISLIIANTEKGDELLSRAHGRLDCRQSSFEKASAGNGQLKHPSDSGKREEILKLYETGGWQALENRFDRSIGWHRYTSQIKSLLPAGVKRILKSLRS